MYKQELVQLHALCVLIRARLEERHGVSADAFRSYDRYGVSPTAIHRRKGVHERAIFHLLDGIETAIDDASSPRDAPRPSTDG